MNRNSSIPDGHADTEIFHPRWSELKLIIMKSIELKYPVIVRESRWSELKLIIMKSIELKYPVIVRERQGRFDHSKIFRPPGVETPGYYLSSLSGLIVSC
ncbi:MAG: hypothetical protein OMM_12253 [Candidatus Magnetoglobus multicellularis str. Araruama]|uniref:Uncharacterized protein n=1 Tax=Candidatus Magnetoglobus multicellularis str. Araruama TaxID=890399 RepID=A0A1V1NW79_9BACT|nr:MAG: hypothetical protein OMM_12253 [Candidatus Magnetoglobus multicellularis str. Araruama]